LENYAGKTMIEQIFA